MYVKPGCPYCQQARDALSAEGLDWEERDATTDRGWRAELMEHSRGQRRGADDRGARRGDRRLARQGLTRGLGRPVGRQAGTSMPRAVA